MAAGRLGIVAIVVALHIAILWLLATQRPRYQVLARESASVPVRVELLPAVRERVEPSRPPAQTTIGSRAAPRAPPSAKRSRSAPAAPQAPLVEAAVPPTVSAELPAPHSAPPSPLRVDDETLRNAVRSSRTELSRRLAADEERFASGLPSGASERLAAAIDQASIPGCLRPDALKHSPIRLGGLLDLPLLAHAAATGKCR